jgi:hypothetical protein
MSSSLYTKLQSIIAEYPFLDLDHPKMYSNRDNFVYTFSTYNRGKEMTDLFRESGFVSIPPVYRVDCNSWLFITSRRLDDMKPMWLDIR